MKSAPARVLPKEKPTPHLALVDNVGVGDPIVAEAKKQQEDRLELIDAGFEPARLHDTGRAPRKRRPRVNRNGPIRRTFTYKGPCDPVALSVAKDIQARHGGYIQKVNAHCVIVTNYPPERRT